MTNKKESIILYSKILLGVTATILVALKIIEYNLMGGLN